MLLLCAMLIKSCCTCAGVELLLFLIPVSVVQYMPNFFFGSLLMVFGIEITADWLFFSYFKASLLLSCTSQLEGALAAHICSGEMTTTTIQCNAHNLSCTILPLLLNSYEPSCTCLHVSAHDSWGIAGSWDLPHSWLTACRIIH